MSGPFPGHQPGGGYGQDGYGPDGYAPDGYGQDGYGPQPDHFGRQALPGPGYQPPAPQQRRRPPFLAVLAAALAVVAIFAVVMTRGHGGAPAPSQQFNPAGVTATIPAQSPAAQATENEGQGDKSGAAEPKGDDQSPAANSGQQGGEPGEPGPDNDGGNG